MDKLAFAKKAATLVVSIGVGAVVGNVIKTSTPEAAGWIQKFSIAIGGFVISDMVGDFAAKHTESKIDEIVTSYNETKDAVTIVIQEQQQ